MLAIVEPLCFYELIKGMIRIWLSASGVRIFRVKLFAQLLGSGFQDESQSWAKRFDSER